MDLSALNIIDYSVFFILFISSLFAFFRGFIGSFLSMVGWIASIYLAYEFYPEFREIIATKITNEIMQLIIGHALLLTILLFAFAILNFIIGSTLKKLTNNFFDRILGLGFGALRGALIIAFIFMIFSTSIIIFKKGEGSSSAKSSEDEVMPGIVKNAQTYPYIKIGRDMLNDFIPQSFNDRAKQVIDKISDKGSDERFLDTAIEMLQNNLTEEQLNRIADRIKDDYKHLSKEDSEKHHLSELLRAYKQNLLEGKIDKNSAISEDEIVKIEKSLQNSTVIEDTGSLEDTY